MLSPAQIEKIYSQLTKNYDKRLPLIFSALGDKCRFVTFHLILLQNEVCVTDVAKICRITVSAASQQLKTLETSGIVIKERMGQMVCFRLNEEDRFIKSLIKLITA